MTDLMHWCCDACGAPNDECDSDIYCCDDFVAWMPREYDLDEEE